MFDNMPVWLIVVLAVGTVWSGLYGYFLYFRTNDVLRWAARVQLRLWSIRGKESEYLSAKRREYIQQLLESSEQAGGRHRDLLRSSGCGALALCALVILVMIALILFR